MIDTIHGYFAISRIGKLLEVLENKREVFYLKTQSKKVIGEIGNISIRAFFDSQGKPYKINFCGSLNKFVHGNNFNSCKRLEIKGAIEKLSFLTKMPFHKAKITRLDIGASIPMKYPAQSYLLLLDYLPNRYKKTNIANETIYFFNGYRCLAFYDKIKENKKKAKTALPSEFVNKNVIRYELRYLKQLGSQLKKERVYASDLYEREFYNQLIIRWRKAYFKIIKNQIPSLEGIGDVKTLLELLALFGIDKIGGCDRVMALIEIICLKGKFTPAKKCRLKKKIREIIIAQKNPLKNRKEIKELNKKIKELASISFLKRPLPQKPLVPCG